MTAATVATAATACALSCVLPFALPAVALASFSGVIAWLDGTHPLISASALLMVIAAWLWIGYRSYTLKARPATSTLVVMLFATVMLGLDDADRVGRGLPPFVQGVGSASRLQGNTGFKGVSTEPKMALPTDLDARFSHRLAGHG